MRISGIINEPPVPEVPNVRAADLRARRAWKAKTSGKPCYKRITDERAMELAGREHWCTRMRPAF